MRRVIVINPKKLNIPTDKVYGKRYATGKILFVDRFLECDAPGSIYRKEHFPHYNESRYLLDTHDPSGGQYWWPANMTIDYPYNGLPIRVRRKPVKRRI